MSGRVPPPQVSPDGKFYWDGHRWVPMAGSQSSKQSHTGRNLGIGCVGLIAVVGVLALIGSINSGSEPMLNWTVDGLAIEHSTVGGSDAVQMTVTNNGSNANNFIIYLNSKDDWFKHHVITDPGGCTINKDLERLECGPLAAGETRIINIGGSPKDAGNIDFAEDAADEEGGHLLYPKLGEITWSETVTA